MLGESFVSLDSSKEHGGMTRVTPDGVNRLQVVLLPHKRLREDDVQDLQMSQEIMDAQAIVLTACLASAYHTLLHCSKEK
jgi:hypothetical protein